MKYTTILPLEFSFGDVKSYFNVTAVRYDGGVLLVDVGFPGYLQILESLMESAGLRPSDVKRIIITHHDGDHIGGLKALLDKYPGIEVMSSAEQAVYITGKEKPLRLQLAEKRYDACTNAEEKKALEEDMKRLSGLQTIDRVTIIKDKDVLPECGIEIVDISGHMPGHLCVYVQKDKALITGDALTSKDGKLCPPDANFTLDMPAAIKSLTKLLDYDIENVVCYHGGLVTGDIKTSLREIIKSGE